MTMDADEQLSECSSSSTCVVLSLINSVHMKVSKL